MNKQKKDVRNNEKINFGVEAWLIDNRRHEATLNFGLAAARLCGFEALYL